ncbi:tripartite tricarboxylate transporter substrate binding protein, partial [Orrella sp. JC864]|uniref:tripartite tricarboxylate transporter substrate binding protein n=1 Tax=Orrella sp. JC864 TaxID=3120298 RepID=UPI00300B7B0F
MPRLSLARRTLIMLAAAAAVSSVAAHAQHSAPLHVILPLSPGSGVDVITRSAQEALSRAFDGQSVVIENRPGSGGVIGTQALVRARPDGTTVGIISNNHSVNPAVLKNLPYDSLADVTPISIIGGSPFIFVVNPDKVPARTAAELQAYLKTRPNELNFGSAGNGTIIHLAGEMFLQAAGVQADHIPYRGTGPMVVDLLGGQIEMGVASLDAVQGHLRSGKLHAIGVMGRQRLKSMPEIPTFVEQGFPDVDVAGWFAVVGPKGLPAEHVQRIHAGFVKAFNDPQVQAGFASRDNFLMLNTPEQAADFLRTEQSRYA